MTTFVDTVAYIATRDESLRKVTIINNPPSVDQSIEEPIESNADFYDYNAEDDSDEEEECVVMQVLQESADLLPVRHDADVR